VQGKLLTVAWILETHAHADHLSAAGYLADTLKVPVAIGQGIVAVQQRFKALFGLGDEFIADGSQFDRLFADGDTFNIGGLEGRVIATPQLAQTWIQTDRGGEEVCFTQNSPSAGSRGA